MGIFMVGMSKISLMRYLHYTAFAALMGCSQHVATKKDKPSTQEANGIQDQSIEDKTFLSLTAASGASTGWPKTLSPVKIGTPTTIPSTTAWAQIPDPTTPTKTIPSYFTGGTLYAMAAGNTGTRSATWSITGIPSGRYFVHLFYRKEVNNATCVKVDFKPTGFTAFSGVRTLNQSNGNLIIGPTTYTTATYSANTPTLGSFTSVYTNITVNSPISIEDGATPNSGTLLVRISDTGCLGGRIVADGVRIVRYGPL